VKRSASLLFLLLLVFSVLVTVSQIAPVKAESKIYIRSDGSVEGTDKILREGDIYTFTDDILDSDGIVVERDNVVVDGSGFTLQGPSVAEEGEPERGRGIDLHFQYDITIKNLQIRDFDRGIFIGNSFGNIVEGNEITNNGVGIEISICSTNKILGNNITNNNKYGIWIAFASDNEVSSNHIANNKQRGIWVDYSSNEIISSNIVTNSRYGVVIEQSSYVTLRNNSMVDNLQSFSVEGHESDHFVNVVDSSNTVNGKPIYYWVSHRDMEIPSDAGYIALVNCTNITVQILNLSGNGQGILLASTTNSTITKTTITNTNDGVYLHSSSNNSIIENYLTDNVQGITFSSSRDNIISRNHVTDNWCAIRLKASSNNTMSTNNMQNNSCGIIFEYSSTNNSVNRNLIENNPSCISFLESSNNMFFHNNFINNTEHFTDLGMSAYWLAPSINIWDDGKKGNYWSDYNGTDTNDDGIGDTPYIIDERNQDNFPLMKQIPQQYTPKEQPETFPAPWVIITTVIIAVIGAAFLVYFLKIKKTTT
jgi:parallel beta-helix repeat protein